MDEKRIDTWARRKVRELVFRLQRLLARGVRLPDDLRGPR